MTVHDSVIANYNLSSSIDIVTSCSRCPAAMWCMTAGPFSVAWKTCHFCSIRERVVVFKHKKPNYNLIRNPSFPGKWLAFALGDWTKLKQHISGVDTEEKLSNTVMLELPAGEVPCSCSVPFIMWRSYVCPTCTSKINNCFTVFGSLSIECKDVGYIKISSGSDVLI